MSSFEQINYEDSMKCPIPISVNEALDRANFENAGYTAGRINFNPHTDKAYPSGVNIFSHKHHATVGAMWVNPTMKPYAFPGIVLNIDLASVTKESIAQAMAKLRALEELI